MDLRTRRIPNRLTIAATILGVALGVARGGWHGAVISVAGVLTGLAVFLPLCLAGKLGAGDVKALGAVGAFIGPVQALLAALCTLLVGGIAGGLALLSSRRHPSSDRPIGQPVLLARQRGVPYGTAIAGGTLLAILLR
jgi:prepilin peptidase CpaA